MAVGPVNDGASLAAGANIALRATQGSSKLFFLFDGSSYTDGQC